MRVKRPRRQAAENHSLVGLGEDILERKLRGESEESDSDDLHMQFGSELIDQQMSSGTTYIFKTSKMKHYLRIRLIDEAGDVTYAQLHLLASKISKCQNQDF